MQGMLVSEVSFGRRMGVVDALRLPFLRMKADEGGTLVYAVVEATEGRCRRKFVAATGEWVQKMQRVSQSSEGIRQILGGGT